MWSCPSRNRIFRCQDHIEIRSGISRAQHPGIMERVSDRSDARCDSRREWPAGASANAVGPHSVVGEGKQDRLFSINARPRPLIRPLRFVTRGKKASAVLSSRTVRILSLTQKDPWFQALARRRVRSRTLAINSQALALAMVPSKSQTVFAVAPNALPSPSSATPSRAASPHAGYPGVHLPIAPESARRR